MTERYNYGFKVNYRFPRHVNELSSTELVDFTDKGIDVFTRGKKSNKEMIFSLSDVSASVAVKRLLYTLTHLASMLNDFNGRSLDFLAMKLITEAIRNLLLATDGKGTKLKEWFKNDSTMAVVILGDEKSKLFVSLYRTLKNPRENY